MESNEENKKKQSNGINSSDPKIVEQEEFSSFQDDSNNENKDNNKNKNEPCISLFNKNNHNNYATKNNDADINHIITTDNNIDIEYQIIPQGVKLENVIFVFVNPRSGAQEGKMIIELVKKNNSEKNNQNLLKFLYNDNDGEMKFAYVFNIIDRDNYLKGCEMLRNFLINSRHEDKIKVLIGGGDGTVLSIVENLNHSKIDLSRCYFGHLPLGTGNDLSNAVGFGGNVQINSDPLSFKKILNKYHEAKYGKIDVWVLKLIVEKERGQIIEFSSKLKISKSIDKNVYKRSFINYFSLGYDARVGFGFEKKRSGFRCWNKMVYFWEGLKKNCCRRTIPLNSFLDAFMVAEPKQTPDDQNQEKNFIVMNSTEIGKLAIEDSIINADHKVKTVFKSKGPFEKMETNSENKRNYKEIFIKGDPVNIICQNINFYMGGTKDIWKKSGNNVGLKVVDGITKKLSKVETETLGNKLTFSEQNYNDQKLEFFTYSSGFKLGFEKIFTGRADKVYHGPGPILIKFKDTPEKSENDKYRRVYLNIDGEYFHIIKPVELRIKLNDELCGGSINFLVNK